MTFYQVDDREHITGVSGGILPVFMENENDFCAACHCRVGEYMREQYGFPYYDDLPGTSREDTKHDLVMAHFKRLATPEPTADDELPF